MIFYQFFLDNYPSFLCNLICNIKCNISFSTYLPTLYVRKKDGMIMKDVLSKEKRYCTNEDYILREIAGETILVPTGASADHFNGMLTLNETSRFL